MVDQEKMQGAVLAFNNIVQEAVDNNAENFQRTCAEKDFDSADCEAIKALVDDTISNLIRYRDKYWENEETAMKKANFKCTNCDCEDIPLGAECKKCGSILCQDCVSETGDICWLCDINGEAEGEKP